MHQMRTFVVATTALAAVIAAPPPAAALDCDPARSHTGFLRHIEDSIADADELVGTLRDGDADAGTLSLVDGRRAALRKLLRDVRATPPAVGSDCRAEGIDELERIRTELRTLAQRAAGTAPKRLTGTGSIAGVVTSSADASPVETSVYLWGTNGAYLGDVVSDASGAYLFSDLAAGTYHVSTRNTAAFVDELYDDVECAGGCLVSTGTQIPVADGATVSGIDFALDPGGSITGTVTDADGGTPIPNLSIWLYDDAGNYVTTVRSEADGTYATPIGLPAGSYFAISQPNSGWLRELYDDIPCGTGYCDPTGGTPIVVPAGGSATADFVLEEGGSISGTVTDTGAAPVANVSVQVYDQTGNYQSNGRTSADGSYTVAYGLPTGSYYVRTSGSSGLIDELFDDIPCPVGDCTVTTGTPVGVVQGMTTPAVDFALGAGAVIEGTVTDAVSGLPLQNMNVRVVDQNGASVTYGNTDAAGDYTSRDGLVPGIYHVWVSYCPGYVRQVHGGGYCFPLSCNVTGGTPVDLTGGGTAVVDIALTPGGAVSGAVTDADTGAGLLNAYLVLHDATGVPLTYAWSTLTGDYEFQTASPPGDYHLVTHLSGFFAEVYDDIPCSGCDITAGTPIPVAAGAVTTAVDVDLRRGGLFSGRVTRSGSLTPVAGAEIRVYDATGALATTVVTDAAGDYAVTEVLPTGTYFAKTLNDQGYVDELYSNIPCPGDTCDPTGGTPIVLADGQVLPGRDFGLSVGGSLSGAVTEAGSGDPVAGAEIRVYDGAGSWASTAVTAADGGYTVGGLNTGTWYALTVSPDHLDQAYGGLPCDGGCDPTLGTPLSVVTGLDTPGVDFVLEPAPTFADGFESGDLGAWSTAVP